MMMQAVLLLDKTLRKDTTMTDRDEQSERYSVAELREAYALFASLDDWGVPSFYENGLIAALRGEYDDEDTERKRQILRLGGKL